MEMSMQEQTAYIAAELEALRRRLVDEGIDEDLFNASLLEEAAYGMANGDDPELMPAVFRETADQMEAGEYTARSGEQRKRPGLTVIEGGGGGAKV